MLEPTRLVNNLDLVLCNDRMLISDMAVDVPFGLSDHNSIVCSMVTDPVIIAPDARPSPVLNWSGADWSNFSNYCQSINWVNIINSSQTVDELWGALTAEIINGVKKFVPFYKTSKKYTSSRKSAHKSNIVKNSKLKKENYGVN